MLISETPLDRQFAACMRRFDPGMDIAVEWAARLACHALGEGHVCLDLRIWAGSEVGPGLRLPSVLAWKQALFTSAVVGQPGDFKPMIVEGDRLYLARYWRYEKNLAGNLLARAGVICDEINLEQLKADLDRLFAHNAGQGWSFSDRTLGLTLAIRRSKATYETKNGAHSDRMTGATRGER